MPKRKWTPADLAALVAAHDAVLDTNTGRCGNFWETVAARLRADIADDPPFTARAVKERKLALEREALARSGTGPITTGWARLVCASRTDGTPATDGRGERRAGGRRDDTSLMTKVTEPRAPDLLCTSLSTNVTEARSADVCRKTIWTLANREPVDRGTDPPMALCEFVLSGDKEVRWRGTRFYLEALTERSTYAMASLHGLQVDGRPLPATERGVQAFGERLDEEGVLALSGAALVVVGPALRGRLAGKNEVLVRGTLKYAVSMRSPPSDFTVPAWASWWSGQKARERVVLVLCEQPQYIGGHYLPLASFNVQGGHPQQLPANLTLELATFAGQERHAETATGILQRGAEGPPTAAVVDQRRRKLRSETHTIVRRAPEQPLAARGLRVCVKRGEGVCVFGDAWGRATAAAAAGALRQFAEGDRELFVGANREDKAAGWARGEPARIHSVLGAGHPMQQKRIEHSRVVAATEELSVVVPQTLRQAMAANADIAALVGTAAGVVNELRSRCVEISTLLIVTGGKRVDQVAPTHFDDHVVVSIVLSGCKTWQVLRPDGIDAQPTGRGTEVAVTPDTHPNAPWVHAIVGAGQVVVLPAKWWHRVISSAEGTFSFAWCVAFE
jgi:hypothetical protein